MTIRARRILLALVSAGMNECTEVGLFASYPVIELQRLARSIDSRLSADKNVRERVMAEIVTILARANTGPYIPDNVEELTDKIMDIAQDKEGGS